MIQLIISETLKVFLNNLDKNLLKQMLIVLSAVVAFVIVIFCD